MLTILLGILWYLDLDIWVSLDLRKDCDWSSWVGTAVLDSMIVYGILEIMNPTGASIGGILTGAC